MSSLKNIIAKDDLEAFKTFVSINELSTYKLRITLDSGSIKIAKYILVEGNLIEGTIDNAKIHIAKIGNLEMMKMLHEVDPTIFSNRIDQHNLLWLSVKYKHLSLVEWLLEKGYRSLNITAAIRSTNIETIKALEKHNIWINTGLLLSRFYSDSCMKKRSNHYPRVKDYNRDELRFAKYVHDMKAHECTTKEEPGKTCCFCNLRRRKEIWKRWELESYDYNCVIQWLPREMIEDTLSLL